MVVDLRDLLCYNRLTDIPYKKLEKGRKRVRRSSHELRRASARYMNKLDDRDTLKILSIVNLAIYSLLLIWLIALKCNIKITISDTYYYFGSLSLDERLEYARSSFVELFDKNAWKTSYFTDHQDILNVAVFIPLGIYISYFTKRFKLLFAFAISLSVSLAFEFLQLFSLIGCFTAIDVLTNTVGGIIGYLFFKIIYRESSLRTVILNILSLVAMTVMIPLLGYAIVNTAKMSDFYIDVLLRRL